MSHALPPALQVFPALARFAALHPRRMTKIPVGCRSTRHLTREDLRRSILHIYHDLGVLVFAGCSAQQVREIGDVLRQMVHWGGPGSVVSMLEDRTVTYKHVREGDVVRGEDLHESMDCRRSGIVKLEAIMRLAKARLKEQLRERVEGMKPAVSGVHTRDIQIKIPGAPAQSGILHQTVSGPRRLPVESWGCLSIMPNTGNLVGEIRFFTVGTGEYLGGAVIHYLMFRQNEETGQSAPFWAHGRMPERLMRAPQLVEERMDKVLDRVLRPLWKMERRVWGEEAEALEQAKERERLEKMRLRSLRDASRYEVY